MEKNLAPISSSSTTKGLVLYQSHHHHQQLTSLHPKSIPTNGHTIDIDGGDGDLKLMGIFLDIDDNGDVAAFKN
ncbi:hypothetical protein TorRG33x02_004360 [Trema orientale]|uniref:Uncharacterized protein n=1 Tax=Trema orientale TaxID=63057 RepID=A0A2P5G276_TREOI|nr:hypothetical protein TorRG33x02_004360 [Trema orientale]